MEKFSLGHSWELKGLIKRKLTVFTCVEEYGIEMDVEEDERSNRYSVSSSFPADSSPFPV